MGKIWTTTIYEERHKVADALLAAIKNICNGEVYVNGSDQPIEVHDCWMKESADGQSISIVANGRIDNHDVRPLITFELTGESAVHILADYDKDEPVLEGLAKLLFAELQPNQANGKSLQGEAAAKPRPKPPEPKSRGGDVTPWLDWYHEMHRSGYKCTLLEIASASDYDYGYIRQKHMIYNKARTNKKR